jgi:DNA (cytosine-5)-methyltransferase 1
LKELNITHEIAFACEIDKYARQTYLANFTPNQMYTDLTAEEWDKPEQYSDLFIGGIPCQAFSLAGKRLGELDKRGLLFYDFYRYVKNQQPKVFIIENVKGLLSDNNGITFQNWCALLGRSMNTHVNMFNNEDSLLYNLHFKVLNSKDFGVPQNRERVFLVGIRNDLPNTFRFPIGERLTKRLKDILEPEVDEKYYLSDKMIAGFVNHAERHQAKGHGFKFEPNDIESVAKTITTAEGSRGYNNFIPEGFINQDTQASAVFSKDGISPTVCAGTHGYAMGYIQEPYCVAMRGRNPENPSDRTTGANTEQRLEPNSQGITNTITSVQKDNLIVVREATKQGYAIAKEVDSINLSNPHSETRRGRVGNQIANTLDTACNQGVVVDKPLFSYRSDNPISTENECFGTLRANAGGKLQGVGIIDECRIRRLTPLECMRLQGYPDSFIKPCSDSQTYKQAGNSITVNVMKAIIKNIIPIL